MDTIDFLKRVLPQAPAYYVQRLWYVDEKTTDDIKSRSFKASSLEALAKIIASESRQGYDVYISMAGFIADAKGHYAKFALSHKSHYQDIDCGPGKAYATQRDALIAVHTFVQTVGLPMPLVVASGRGLHVYWPYTEDITNATTWLKMAWLFRAVCEHAGLMIDRPCGIDPVRLLRPPGTHHFKDRAAPKRVLTLPQQDHYQPVPVEDVAKALLAYAQQHAIQWSVPVEQPEVDTDNDLGANLPGLDPYSATRIGQAGCIAVRWFMATGGDAMPPSKLQMSQGDWMAMGRLAKFSTEGEAWFHQYGAKYSGYSRAESQKVLNRIAKRGVTCESLVQDPVARKEICGRCTHYGKINTPLHLGIAKVIPLRPIPPDQDTPDPLFQPNTQLVIPPAMKKRGYDFTASGTVHQRTNAEGKPVISIISNYWIEHIEKLDVPGSMHYRIHWLAPHGRRTFFEATGAQINSRSDDIVKKAGDVDIGTGSGQNRVENFMGYIRDWVNNMSAIEAQPAVMQLGWQRDHSFVLGIDSYKNGKRSAARLIGPAVEEARMLFGTRGTLEGQINAMRMFFPNHPDYLHAHFLILASMVPLYLSFDDIPSPIISAHSLTSGHGKSLACRGAAGLWGDPVLVEMKGQRASTTSVNNRLGLAGTLPIVLDEMTASDPKRIYEIIDLVQGNKTGDRAKADGYNRLARVWHTVVIVSSNDPLRVILSRLPNLKTGTHMRMIEFEYNNPTVKAMGAVASTKPLLENFGHLGRELLLRFTADIDAQETLYRSYLTRIRNVPGETQDDGGERSWQRCLAAIMALAQITTQWGLLDIDMKAIHVFCIELLKKMRAELQEVSPDMLTRLNAILAGLSSKAVFVQTAKPLVQGTNVDLVGDDKRIPHEVMMRQERDTGLTYVNSVEFNRQADAFARPIMTFAIENGLCQPKMRKGIRLRAYLGVPDGRVNCYVFDHKAIEALSRVAQGSAVIDDYEGIYDPPAKTGAHLHTVPLHKVT